MGTRGWLVFLYKGKYYILYNNNDSYPRIMGREIVEQLVVLVKRFHGDVQAACGHWGELLVALKIPRKYCDAAADGADGADDESENHSFNKTHVFENLKGALQDQSCCVPFAHKPSTSKVEMTMYEIIFIEYVWEIDLDAGCLSMMQPRDTSCDFKRTWSMKSFYRMCASEAYLEMWVQDAGSIKRIDDSRVSHSIEFMRSYSIVLLQAHIRRYLAVRKALMPGTGVLYQVAKKRFEGRISDAKKRRV